MRAPTIALVSLLAVGSLACGGDAAEEAAQTAAEAMQQAANAMQNAANSMGNNEGDSNATPLDAQALQDLMPEELAGMDRTSSERQSVGAAGIQMATATAKYEGDGRTLTVNLMSGGGLMAGPAMAFAMVDFDRSTDDGYERTVTLHGFKGMETYEENGDYRRAEITLLVGNNVMIKLESEGMTMDELEDALDDLDPESIG